MVLYDKTINRNRVLGNEKLHFLCRGYITTTLPCSSFANYLMIMMINLHPGRYVL